MRSRFKFRKARFSSPSTREFNQFPQWKQVEWVKADGMLKFRVIHLSEARRDFEHGKTVTYMTKSGVAYPIRYNEMGLEPSP